MSSVQPTPERFLYRVADTVPRTRACLRVTWEIPKDVGIRNQVLFLLQLNIDCLFKGFLLILDRIYWISSLDFDQRILISKFDFVNLWLIGDFLSEIYDIFPAHAIVFRNFILNFKIDFLKLSAVKVHSVCVFFHQACPIPWTIISYKIKCALLSLNQPPKKKVKIMHAHNMCEPWDTYLHLTQFRNTYPCKNYRLNFFEHFLKKNITKKIQKRPDASIISIMHHFLINGFFLFFSPLFSFFSHTRGFDPQVTNNDLLQSNFDIFSMCN